MFIDTSGSWVVEAKYDRVKDFHYGASLVKKGKQWYILNSEGVELGGHPNIDYCSDFLNGLCRIKDNRNKYGFVDVNGQFIVPPNYDNATNFSEGIAAVYLDTRWGFIDSSGKKLTPSIFEKIDNFNSGIALVKVNGVTQYLKRDGTFLNLPRKVKIYHDFNNNLAPVKLKGRWGYIDTTGQMVIPAEYSAISKVTNDYVACAKYFSELNTTYWGVVNTKNETVLPFRYTKVKINKSNIAMVNQSGTWRYYNLIKKQMLPLPDIYKVVHYFNDGIARVKINEQFAYIDTTGSLISNNSYPDARDFKNGMAAVLIGNKWGYINSQGEIIIKPQFDAAKDFYEL